MKLHGYADDSLIYNYKPTAIIQTSIINDDLNRITSWSKSRGLKLNTSKTFPVTFTSKLCEFSEKLARL